MKEASLYESDYALMSVDRFVMEQAKGRGGDRENPSPCCCSSSTCCCCGGSCRSRGRKRDDEL